MTIYYPEFNDYRRVIASHITFHLNKMLIRKKKEEKQKNSIDRPDKRPNNMQPMEDNI